MSRILCVKDYISVKNCVELRPVTLIWATRKYSHITTLTRVTNYVHESRAICVCDRLHTRYFYITKLTRVTNYVHESRTICVCDQSHAHQPLANSCISSHSSSESRTTYTHHELYVYATGHAHMSHSQILSYHHTHHLSHELRTYVTRCMHMQLVTLVSPAQILSYHHTHHPSHELCTCVTNMRLVTLVSPTQILRYIHTHPSHVHMGLLQLVGSLKL